MCTAVGVLIARTLGRRARRPRSTFVRTTIVLTALSIVPDVILSAAISTKVTLVLTHLVAAAIVIPALAPASPSRAPAEPDPMHPPGDELADEMDADPCPVGVLLRVGCCQSERWQWRKICTSGGAPARPARRRTRSARRR